ncbi:type IV toxin-antitoxin system AbiEi family antitoxin domain-containing protein [Tersicoccus sp. MR15.9]|uniref:endonuclease domain-containing protein n=1 Tax=Tersicoccus mangrovi TaxID=3121635 RepID=UPI002FE561B3
MHEIRPAPSPDALGLRSSRTLELSGYPPNRVRRLVDRGVLRRVRRGWYISQDRWQRLDADDRYRVVVYAGGFSLSDAAVISHHSAAALHGLHLLAVPDQMHARVAAPVSGRGTRTGVSYHRLAVQIVPTTTAHGLHISGLEDVVRDVATVASHREALVIADQAARRGLDSGALRSWIADNPGRHGVRRLALVIDRLDPAAESAGETLTRVLLHEWAVPLPVSQCWIPTAIGDHRVDFAWPDRRIVLEFDGRGKYFDYRPTAEALYEERRREKALINAGWRVIRIGWADVTRNTEAFRRLITVALAASTQRPAVG